MWPRTIDLTSLGGNIPVSKGEKVRTWARLLYYLQKQYRCEPSLECLKWRRGLNALAGFSVNKVGTDMRTGESRKALWRGRKALPQFTWGWPWGTDWNLHREWNPQWLPGKDRKPRTEFGNPLSLEHTFRDLRIQGCRQVTQPILKWVNAVTISKIQTSVSFLNPWEGKRIVFLWQVLFLTRGDSLMWYRLASNSLCSRGWP